MVLGLVRLVELEGVAQGVLDLAHQVLAPLHVQRLRVLLLVVFLKRLEVGLLSDISNCDYQVHR